MPASISIPVSADVFARLQRIAVPLVDDKSSVIVKLLDHWEQNPPAPLVTEKGGHERVLDVWRSPRGDVLPVGISLQGPYLGKTFRATVERNGIRHNGKLYPNLTAAAVAAKGQLGRKGRAASTNGREFWKLQDPNTESWIPVSALRPHPRIDPQELLAEALSFKPNES